MPAAKTVESTEATSGTQTRFTVALPKEVGAQIDALATKMAEEMRKQFGVGVELSRGQVVTSVVQSALKTFDDIAAAKAAEEAAE
jgi:hypothetical protein